MMRRRLLLALSTLATLQVVQLLGCVPIIGTASARVEIRDKNTKAPLNDCMLNTYSHTETSTLLPVAYAGSFGKIETDDLAPLKSGGMVTAGGIHLCISPLGLTTTQWSFGVYAKGHLRRGFGCGDLEDCERDNKPLVVELEPYVAGESLETDSEAYFMAYGVFDDVKSCRFSGEVAATLARWMADMMDDLCRGRPQEWATCLPTSGSSPEYPYGFSRRNVEALAKLLREQSKR